MQELVADDNAEQAALFLPLAGASCLYKFNRPDYWFQCLLLGLEWHRAQQEFRCAEQPQPAEASILMPAAGPGVAPRAAGVQVCCCRCWLAANAAEWLLGGLEWHSTEQVH